MNRWGNPKRTRGDRERDALNFIHCASDDALSRVTSADLAARYGCEVKFCEYHLQLRQGGGMLGGRA